MKVHPQIETLLDTLPIKPGCYLMKDVDGKVIYVGKAINLRNRVRSYFHSSAHGHPKTSQLVRRITDIEWIVVGSELEALILEMNLIKKYRPHYNVRLKDDKRYPYIKVHWADPYPKVTVTRQMIQDGSRYYGPYTSVWAVHQAALDADIGGSVSGIAGPGGSTPEKPVGLVWIGLSAGGLELAWQTQWYGDRAAIKAQSAEEVLRLLVGYLEEDGKR